MGVSVRMRVFTRAAKEAVSDRLDCGEAVFEFLGAIEDFFGSGAAIGKGEFDVEWQ